jgi:(E)-4-hydroxy-3-methylbut-2-enyl-diphosphate synthase
MTNTDTRDVQATIRQIKDAADAGVDIMRIGIPDEDALAGVKTIIEQSPVPLVGDIHFDYRLAVGAIRAGIHKLRINPGNIGSRRRIREVVKAAADHGVPIRVGVNAGSLERDLLKKYGHPTAEALAESALRNAAVLEDAGFSDIVLSLKGSDVPMTVAAYRLAAEQCSYPLHIGITEAGTAFTGAVRSAVGVGILLAEGIGDTIRISLAADPILEIRTAYRILESLGLRRRGPTVIACPTCSRTEINIIELAERVEKHLLHRTEPLTVAVMGCIVNGPGEAREADLGIAGGKGEAILFRKGKKIKIIEEKDIIPELLKLFDEVASEA